MRLRQWPVKGVVQDQFFQAHGERMPQHPAAQPADGALGEDARANAVAAAFRDPRVFLGRLKYKAGLPPDFWDPTVKLSRYTVIKWSEADQPN